MKSSATVSNLTWLGAIAAMLLCIPAMAFSIVDFTYGGRVSHFFGTQGYLDYDSDDYYAVAYPLDSLGWQFPSWVFLIGTMIGLLITIATLKRNKSPMRWLMVSMASYLATILALVVSWNIDYAQVDNERGQGWEGQVKVLGPGAYALLLVAMFLLVAWGSLKRQST